MGELVTAVKTGEDIDYQNYLLLTILGLQLNCNNWVLIFSYWFNYWYISGKMLHRN